VTLSASVDIKKAVIVPHSKVELWRSFTLITPL